MRRCGWRPLPLLLRVLVMVVVVLCFGVNRFAFYETEDLDRTREHA